MNPEEKARLGTELAIANAALGRDPADTAAAIALGRALLALGRSEDLCRLAVHGETAIGTGRGWALLAGLLMDAKDKGNEEQVLDFHDSCPTDFPGYLLATYVAGCVFLRRNDMDAAMEQFDWFRRHARFYAGHLPFANHPLLNLIYRQGRLMAAPDEIDRRRADLPDTPPVLSHLGDLSAAAAGVPALFTCMDERYFQLLGRDFVEANAALNPDSPLLLHVIAPSRESLATLEEMAQSRPGRFAASLEHDPPFRTVTYYASARFFVAEALMDHHGRPLISLDSEIKMAIDALGVPRVCHDLDFACFKTERDEPGSVWQASVMWFGQGKGTRHFLSLLRAYCRPELGYPSLLTWLLDQAALMACRHYCKVRGLPLAFGDLRVLLGLPLGEAVSEIAPPEAKEADKLAKMKVETRDLGPLLGDLYSRI